MARILVARRVPEAVAARAAREFDAVLAEHDMECGGRRRRARARRAGHFHRAQGAARRGAICRRCRRGCASSPTPAPAPTTWTSRRRGAGSGGDQHAGRADRLHRRPGLPADPRRLPPGAPSMPRSCAPAGPSVTACRTCWACARAAARSASSAWAGSARRWRGGRRGFDMRVLYHNRKRLPSRPRGGRRVRREVGGAPAALGNPLPAPARRWSGHPHDTGGLRPSAAWRCVREHGPRLPGGRGRAA